MFASLTAVARKIEPDLLLQERDHSQSESIACASIHGGRRAKPDA
jgi:hypothetical protein